MKHIFLDVYLSLNIELSDLCNPFDALPPFRYSLPLVLLSYLHRTIWHIIYVYLLFIFPSRM